MNKVTAIILAGGKGTRLASRLQGMPKPLVPIGGQPLLQRQLCLLQQQGIHKVVVLVNFKADVIARFCSQHDNFGLDLQLVDDGEPRGTAGAVLHALPQLAGSKDLLVIYGDTLFNIDLPRMLAFHRKHDGAATLFLHPNAHPQDSDLVELDTTQRISAMYPYPHPEGAEYANLVNAALYVCRTEAIVRWCNSTPSGIFDFAKHLFPQMMGHGQHLYGYQSPEYIRDIGTPERLDAAEADFDIGTYAAGSLVTPRPAVFLDRDGVINKENGFIHRKEDFELLPGVAGAIRTLNRAGILCVVVTNQPVIARGECTEVELARIHARMDTLLGKEGAYIDRLYYCPHHPDKGFADERPDLKIKCTCRKPEIGMLQQAAIDLNIDMTQSWLVGDRTGDILAANRAGVRSILVRTGYAGQDGKYDCIPDFTVQDLAEAVHHILYA